MSYESEPKRKFDDGELTKNEPKGPYSHSIYAGDAKVLNAAYAAGRASRDGLREALMQILGELDYAYESPDDYPLPSLEKYAPIIAADEEEGK